MANDKEEGYYEQAIIQYAVIKVCYKSVKKLCKVHNKLHINHSEYANKRGSTGAKAPVILKDGSHFGSRTCWANKIVLIEIF